MEHLELAKTLSAVRRHRQLGAHVASQITESNAALFDPEHDFAGCIAGIHHVLHRQGLMASTRTLNPDEMLSPGQAEAIDRICQNYPHLTDDDFVAEHLDDWLR